MQQRASVDRLDELVAAEPARPAAGEDDDADPARCHRPTPAARGPGTCPASVRRRSPRRSRSARMAMTYLRLVPVASRKAAGVSGARDDIASAWTSSAR